MFIKCVNSDSLFEITLDTLRRRKKYEYLIKDMNQQDWTQNSLFLHFHFKLKEREITQHFKGSQAFRLCGQTNQWPTLACVQLRGTVRDIFFTKKIYFKNHYFLITQFS